MKKMKKLISFLLTMIMVLSMAFGSMAAMEGTLENGSITIENAVKDQTYSAYQILYLESYNAESNAYAYKANSAWESWLKTQTDYVSFDKQDYVTWVNNADAAAFAKAAQAYAKENSIKADAEETASGTTVKFENLKLGYYLVDTTLGTLCSLDTTNPSVTMKEKNEAPTVEKEVQEDSDNSWGETNDADINQTVNYKATITVKPGAENYVLHDTMSKGLTFKEIVRVTVDGANVEEGDNTYTVIIPGTEESDVCTFEIKFANDYIKDLVGKQIVVEYSAILNEDAVVGLPGNPNDIYLEYGDENQPSSTPKDTTITYTWDADVFKFTEKDDDKVALAGAKFKLSTTKLEKDAIKFHFTKAEKEGEVDTYQVCSDDEYNSCKLGHITEIVTDESGKFHIEGLDSGTYYLIETQAPAGYNKLATPIEVTITGATEKDGELTYTTVVTEVENKSGTELPSTGGTGTTIFYIVGGILVVAAGVLLVVRKRANMEE